MRISREKALSWTPLETVKNMINDIYDSFDTGSCEDCKYIDDRGMYCNQNSIFVPKDGYCWQYEKEITNDNSTKANGSKK